jgi:hypothetical protein
MTPSQKFPLKMPIFEKILAKMCSKNKQNGF